MQESEANLNRAAIDFLEAAEAVVEQGGLEARVADPLDEVDTDLFSLGPFEPVLGADELAELKRRLGRERLLPATLAELVSLARQVATTILEG